MLFFFYCLRRILFSACDLFRHISKCNFLIKGLTNFSIKTYLQYYSIVLDRKYLDLFFFFQKVNSRKYQLKKNNTNFCIGQKKNVSELS